MLAVVSASMSISPRLTPSLASTAANGAGQDGRVFLMQVTTEGDLSGAINLQLFPASGDYDQVRYRFEFKGKGEYLGIAIE